MLFFNNRLGLSKALPYLCNVNQNNNDMDFNAHEELGSIWRSEYFDNVLKQATDNVQAEHNKATLNAIDAVRTLFKLHQGNKVLESYYGAILCGLTKTTIL